MAGIPGFVVYGLHTWVCCLWSHTWVYSIDTDVGASQPLCQAVGEEDVAQFGVLVGLQPTESSLLQ